MDLDFRSKTYFRPQKLEQYLLSRVKGAVVRRSLQELFDAGRHAEIGDLLRDGGLSARDRKALEAIHPMFMGGNYLPDTEDAEVEIARIVLRSTTHDVTSVYARPEDGWIHYRVVDEYGGDTLQGLSEKATREPMTLREFTDFFLHAWRLEDVVEMNYEDDLEAGLRFFSASSDFYPEFGALCRARVRARYAVGEQQLEEEGP